LRYLSTRGEAPPLTFEGAMLAGLARDGGLYMPEVWPRFSPDEIAAFAGLDYADAAARILKPFLSGDPCDAGLKELLAEAYRDFHHPAVTPLRQIGSNSWVLELFHGPTLAFKDLAMQVLARLMNQALERRGTPATVVGATSGDTGAAAIEAYRGLDMVDVFILHPKGRVSDVQRRQMTTATEPNVHNLAIEGTFDDCQALVKGLFNDGTLRDGLNLTGVNSINIARILAQIVYYFAAAAALGAPGRSISFSVPTGNFGDIFAAYAAKAMGLPIERLVVATNLNDSLPRTFVTGIFEPRGVVSTSSPSMDIQLASNFERLLFELGRRDAREVRKRMSSLRESGSFHLGDRELEAMRSLFAAHAVDERETEMTIRSLYQESGFLADPHTAVGVAASRREKVKGPMVVLSTAHPAKFPDAVMRATGTVPEQPERLKAKLAREERVTVLPNDFAAVAAFISERAKEGAAAAMSGSRESARAKEKSGVGA
jgi:threonine synthase